MSAPGPVAGTDGQLFTYNNPNGSVLDRGIVPSLDGVRLVPLPGRSGVARLDGRALFDLGDGFGITTGFYNLRTFGRDGEGDLLGDASHSISVRFDPAGGTEEIALPALADAVALNPETNVAVVPVGGVGLAARFKGISLVDLSERRGRRTLPIDDLAFDACVIPKTNTAVVAGMTPVLGAFRGNVYVIDLGDETIKATVPITAFAPTSVACNPVTHQALVGGQTPNPTINAQAAGAVLDLETQQIVGTFEFPAVSYMLYQGGVAINPATNTGVALVNSANGGGEGRLYRIDLSEYRVLDDPAALDGREGNRVVIDPATDRALITITGRLQPTRDPAALMAVDLDTGLIAQTIPIGSFRGVTRPFGLAVNPETQTTLVSDALEGKVSVIDLDRGAVTFSIQLPSRFITGRNAVAVDPATDTAVAVLSEEVQVFRVPY